ncbi:hypothetical protein TTHERM_000078869 (macronuclear) [Tetrahymena thermophila SB210]|uniref:Uncharacterized protein n=1 Tax=Tetrahymena thermophila (strain SB210) TaxID=312017 RepID=W7XAS3_TETTS|nr:hypothetical protein TTHERM_000078869 [Tetrahymena thermophila SB210]EWS74447.1 hypothetical protein TTHERM_000078869 [Tetrahymena thermophila SB210]|eukprot:XP_012653024.1 hypothetical protein TTHERM_000078869 [Tetrahymena thermophila SB210]
MIQRGLQCRHIYKSFFNVFQSIFQSASQKLRSNLNILVKNLSLLKSHLIFHTIHQIHIASTSNYLCILCIAYNKFYIHRSQESNLYVIPTGLGQFHILTKLVVYNEIVQYNAHLCLHQDIFLFCRVNMLKKLNLLRNLSKLLSNQISQTLRRDILEDHFFQHINYIDYFALFRFARSLIKTYPNSVLQK